MARRQSRIRNGPSSHRSFDRLNGRETTEAAKRGDIRAHAVGDPKERHMKQEQGRVNLPALGMATALALVVTMGVPAAMQFTAPHVDGAALVAARALPPDVTHVAIQPGTIEVVAVRERSTLSRWLTTASRRAG
jgi:hypothetical protein